MKNKIQELIECVMQQILNMFFSIITPTTGHPNFEKQLQSILNQSILPHIQVEHLIVIDGKEQHSHKVFPILDKVPIPSHLQSNLTRHIFELPFPTGIDHYNGHKVYASISQLVHGKYVILSDEDNWWSPDHLESFYLPIQHNSYDWLYCLRTICESSEPVCLDLCESLGHLSTVFYNPTNHLIDTNCYCIRKDIMIRYSPIWNHINTNTVDDPDRHFARKLLFDHPNFYCTKKHTLQYYVNNRPGSVKKELFFQGNQLIEQLYQIPNPWASSRQFLYIVHFDPDHTEQIIQRFYQRKYPDTTFQDWQLNLLDGLNPNDFILRNAYTQPIPSGSIVLFHLCHPQFLPGNLLKRKDLVKIIHTIESPNIRHQEQWKKEFLLEHFTIVSTYWKDMIGMRKNNMIYFPFLYRLHLQNPLERVYLEMKNVDTRKSTCIVLENRPYHQTYEINGITLQSQDYLRELYAKEIPNMYCYGRNWKKLHETMYTEVNSGEKDRMVDHKRTIDYYREHTFALIIENTNARGYVSEKIYDAFLSGAIPLYYGNIDIELTPIPENMYIDLRKYTPEKLRKRLVEMTVEEIEGYRQAIYEQREKVFESVSVDRYGRYLQSIFKKIKG